MSVALYLPRDLFSETTNDLDLAADYLELKAFFSPDKQALTQDITDALDLSAEEDYETVEDELQDRGEAASGAVARIAQRQRLLGASYPFAVDDAGDVVSYNGQNLTLGCAAYIISLILSHLKSVSEVLRDVEVYPSDEDVRLLRLYFQYFATAALAAEVGGPAWSFGFPRPDKSGFIAKLGEIWTVLRDGRVSRDPSAPPSPKDDQVDVFAWREHKDGLPGFLLAAAQVATGANWKEKSLKAHVSGVFGPRWFSPTPATVFVCYHIVPFALPDHTFRDDVLVLGNILHRSRLPFRVLEAEELANRGVSIEAFDRLTEAVAWLQAYESRATTS